MIANHVLTAFRCHVLGADLSGLVHVQVRDICIKLLSRLARDCHCLESLRFYKCDEFRGIF